MGIRDAKNTKPYSILGIDPGTNFLGYAIIEVHNKDLKLITLGSLHLKKYSSHTLKLKEIYLQLQEIIEHYLPIKVSIEAPFYGKNIQSMLKLGRAQGVAMAAAITMGLEISEFSPKKIKQSITGNGNASKLQVSAMLESILSIKFSKNNLDASDALAAAICLFNHTSYTTENSPKYSSWEAFVAQNESKIIK